jgi:hypothetical protein
MVHFTDLALVMGIGWPSFDAKYDESVSAES